MKKKFAYALSVTGAVMSLILVLALILTADIRTAFVSEKEDTGEPAVSELAEEEESVPSYTPEDENAADPDLLEEGEEASTISSSGSSVSTLTETASGSSVSTLTATASGRSVSTLSTTASGTCGDSLTWTLSSSGVFTVKGSGDMTDYSSSSARPWYDVRTSITSVVIGSGVTSIGDYAFAYCYNVASVSLPSSVTDIGIYAFINCMDLTKVTLPSGVTSIGAYAFAYCYDLTKVTLSSSLKSIGRYAFACSDAIGSVTLPSKLETIYAGAFYGCSDLTISKIPSGVRTIGASAFYGCSSLTLDQIPAGVTTLGAYAFYGCSSIDEMTFLGDAPEYGGNVWSNALYICYYGSNSGWSSAKSSWTVPDGTGWADLETVTKASSFKIDESSYSVKTGKKVKITTNADDYISSKLVWSSSNSKKAYVNASGKVTGISAGTVTITAKTEDGTYKATCKVKVSASTSGLKTLALTLDDAKVTTNLSANNYTVSGSVVGSYLIANDDGTYTRVENTSGTKVVIETYSSSWELKSTKTLKGSLSYFGGFYSGENYNFLVYGQTNSSESDSKEVLRVVKYSKSWKKLDTLKIKGENTYTPFSSGSLRMTETDGILYIHTCHTMYKTSDGYHHQANMTFAVKESTMKVTDSYSDIMNVSVGYVSHSFNQFIQTDGTYVYRVDHGDAYPRSVVVTKASVSGSLTSVSYKSVLSIQGTSGANATGVSVGGFELSTDNCLVAGNSVDQSSESTYSSSGTRNIFLTITSKDLGTSKVKWITDYEESDKITVRTPQLVKISSDVFLLMWEEVNAKGTVRTKMILVGGDGTLLSSKVKLDARLSDCQPAVSSSGLVSWYVSDGEDVTLYRVNAYRLAETAKSLTSASLSLSSTAYTYDGETKKPTVTVKINGKKLKKGTDYTVSYSSGRKEIGKYKVTVKGKGDYTGTVKLYFTIKPKQAKISSASSSSSGKITVKWSKVSGSVSYQIAYKKKGSSTWSYKNVSSSTYKKTLTKLKSGKSYYIKVRAYKKVNGTTYYGKWSKQKTVKVKS